MLRQILLAVVVCFCFILPAFSAGPEDQLAGAVKVALGKSFDNDWSGLDKIPGIKWAPLPPTSLTNCLPDGGCFTRQGTATFEDRTLLVIASGARSIVTNLYFRGKGAPIGADTVLAALKRAGFSQELARCPVKGTPGGTNWYRLKSASTMPGVFAIQSSCNGQPCEGFQLTLGEDLPKLQAKQLSMYSEQCSGAADTRAAVATSSPQEAVAQALAAAIGSPVSDWGAIANVVPGAKWFGAKPQKSELTYKLDPNPYSMSGNVALAQRQFSVMASGTPTQPKTLYFDEGGLHPRGEDVLGLLRRQGFDVKLARCGPVYTESTNNWYAVTSAKTKPVMLLQSIRVDGKQLQDGYAIRFDNTLPKRDPRDRDPGVNGCK
ncbi:MAG TPA: hypothetical protein VHR84_05170 [Terriglobales bacterium]|jgi:hypothetical protein|nr:hypothetical protein [Terriglobales bacterium]